MNFSAETAMLGQRRKGKKNKGVRIESDFTQCEGGGGGVEDTICLANGLYTACVPVLVYFTAE